MEVSHKDITYNMDNCCVELKFNDSMMTAINTIAAENEIADNMYQRSKLTVFEQKQNIVT